VNPVLADANGQIIAGHGRVEAAKQLGLTSVPIEHLSQAEIRAYTLADNRLAEKAVLMAWRAMTSIHSRGGSLRLCRPVRSCISTGTSGR
jgi:hypothetical protein